MLNSVHLGELARWQTPPVVLCWEFERRVGQGHHSGCSHQCPARCPGTLMALLGNLHGCIESPLSDADNTATRHSSLPGDGSDTLGYGTSCIT